MDEKLKEVLETPQVHMFKHENVFGKSFNEEINKQIPDFLRMNSLTNTIDPPSVMNSSAPSTATTSPTNTSTGSFINFFNGNSNNAPKKNLLFRTISQSDIEFQKQDSIKMVESINSNYFSSQNSASSNQSSVPTSESIDQNINSLINKSNNNNYRLLNDLATSQTDSTIVKCELKRKSTDLKPNENFSINLGERITKQAKQQHQSSSLSQNNFCNNTNSQIKFQDREKFSNVDDEVIKPSSGSFDIERMENGQVINKPIKTQNNCVFYDSPKNGYTPDSLNNTSRSSSFSNEDLVTSSDQNLGNKTKPKSRSINLNSDIRKQQIRNSNREAARRCRERRRTYIETLEANIRNLESKQKALLTDNTSLQKEVASLKKIISDNKYNSTTNTEPVTENSVSNQLRIINTESNHLAGKGVPLMLAYFDNGTEAGNTITMSNNPATNGNANNQQVLQQILNALMNNNNVNNNGNNQAITNNSINGNKDDSANDQSHQKPLN